ncbi:protein of unknown function [Methylacidimicrobium sp. AP8]|uniref:hypothetical protein n=1 Tax=Methylacidimicrobium sp. AP8 TaxID=2730359 RepID=UPI0018C0D0B4|nr:hypothetical protein [Methylacidimicrobium sp. AP8]CAB4242378.1 protein of unknown function [Methylacidimicrobium sp. AP8]
MRGQRRTLLGALRRRSGDRQPLRKLLPPLCGALAGACLLLSSARAIGGIPPRINPPITARDAFGREVVLNAPGYVTVVLSSSEKTQQATRRAAGALEHFQTTPGFRLIVLVDLHGSVAAWMPGYVSRRMQEDLRRETIRLQMLSGRDRSRPGWRPFVCAIPDFSGQTVRSLGWRADRGRLRATVYDRHGMELAKWNNLEPKEYSVVEALVDRALRREG